MLAARSSRVIAPKAARGPVLSALVLCAVLQGCAKPEAPPPPPPAAPLPPHAGPPAARQCSVVPFTIKDGGSADVTMTLSSEGGYCAASLLSDEAVPFAVGLVPVPPLHGVSRVVHYNGKTSVEYSPQPGFVGHDSFIVKLIVRGKPGYTTLSMSVNVK